MKWNLEAVCPVCARSFPCAQLHAHIVAEEPVLRREVMQAIRDRYPDWVLERGVCRNCWEVFRRDRVAHAL